MIGSFSGLETSRFMHIGEAVRSTLYSMLFFTDAGIVALVSR